MQRARILAAVTAVSLSVGTLALSASGTAGAAPPPALPRPAGAMLALPRTIRGGMTRLRAQSISPDATTLATPVAKMTVHDGTGDADFPQGDLTGSGILQSASGTAFGATVSSPVNPLTDDNWLVGNAFVTWGLDVDNDGFLDRVVLIADSTAGHLIAEVLDGSLQHVYCTVSATYVAHVGYRTAVSPSCMPKLTKARFVSFMIYTDDPNVLNPDFAPDSGSAKVSIATTTTRTAAPKSGYWMLGADGHVYAFGGAVGFAGSVPGAAAMAPRRDGKGYWVVDVAGHVFTYGTAGFHGGSPTLRAGEFVSTISATPSSGGYWLFTNKGRAFPYGNAPYYGDMSGAHLNGPIVASVATPTGYGYYMVGSDGGIFSFGDARFHGSTGNLRLNKPVVGISPTADGRGYWLVGSDGGVFAFNAPFRGSMGGTHLNRSVDGLVAFGNGYLMAASDGGIFDFSNKPFYGSLASNPPSAPIIGLAAFTS